MKKSILCIARVAFLVIILMNGSKTAKAQNQLTANVFSTYYGGNGGDFMTYVACDKEGNVIIAGHGDSQNLPVVSSFQDKNKLGPSDGFIAKFNPAMTQLIFSTYLGGSGYDEIKDVVVDSSGNIYVTGITESSDFPVTKDGFDTILGGGRDGFLSKFSPLGALLYSTYIGGGIEDYGMRIAIIDTNLVLLAGSTRSNDFPLKPAISDTIKGGLDVFLMELDIVNDSIIFSNRFGGSKDESPFSVKRDGMDNIYVCGYTQSSDFPLLAGINSSYGGKEDGFICKLNSMGELLYSSLIGGTKDDRLIDLTIDQKNEVYFLGGTASSGLTCSPNAFSSVLKGLSDNILGKLNSAGDSLLYFSYFGGNNIDNLILYTSGSDTFPYCYGKINLLGKDKIVIAGKTNSNDFPVSKKGYKKKADNDIFLTVLGIENKEILYFTYFGSPYDDELEGLSVLNDSVIFISGNVGPGIPVSPGAFMTTYKDGGDAAVARFIFKEDVTSTLKDISSGGLVKVRPNPSSGVFNITFTESASSGNLEVFDITGRLVFAKTMSPLKNQIVDLRDRPKGMYLLKISGPGISAEEKIMKE